MTALPQPKTKVTLTGAQETLLGTLYAKYHDLVYNPKPVLRDEWARHVFDQLDYDFSKLGMNATVCAALTRRSWMLDQWVTEFLDVHGDSERGATVLHMACGLDARSLRLTGEGPVKITNMRWIDVDVPDVVELRRKLLPAPEGVDYTLLGVDVASPDNAGWLEQMIPADRPTVVVFEGLTMYLTPEEGADLLKRLVARFQGQGGQLLFDGVSSLVVWLQSVLAPMKTGAVLRWGIDDPEAFERLLLDDNGEGVLRLLDDVPSCELPGVKDYPLVGRWVFYTTRWLPVLRYVHRNLRFSF